MKYITLKSDMSSVIFYTDKVFQQVLDENILKPEDFYFIPNDLYESKIADLTLDGNKVYFKVDNKEKRTVIIDRYEPIDYNEVQTPVETEKAPE